MGQKQLQRGHMMKMAKAGKITLKEVEEKLLKHTELPKKGSKSMKALVPKIGVPSMIELVLSEVEGGQVHRHGGDPLRDFESYKQIKRFCIWQANA